MRGARLLGVLALFAAGALCSFRSTYEPDLHWHLAQGRALAQGALVRTNLFSASWADYPQPYTPWLFDLVSYGLYAHVSPAALQLADALLVALALGLSFLACRERAGPAASWLAVALGVLVAAPRVLPRPHLVSFAGIAALVWLIERAHAQRSARPLWFAVPVVALWANLHVEALFGVALLALHLVGEALQPTRLDGPRLRSAGLATLGTAGATLLTPYGTGLPRYLYENSLVPGVVRIAELQPPYFPPYAAFFGFGVLLFVLVVLRPEQARLFELLVAVAFAGLALRHLRFTSLLFFATAPMVAARLSGFFQQGALHRTVSGLLLAGALPFLPEATNALVHPLAHGEDALRPPELFSPDAVRFIREQRLRGPVFNSNNLGGYLTWELYPDVRVFQDSRLQAYPTAHFTQIMESSGDQARWNELVRGVDWAVLSSPRANELSGAGRFPRTEWATVFWDDACEVLVRRGGAFADVALRLEYRVLLPGFDQQGASDDPRLLAEAQRHVREAPRSRAGWKALCASGDASACAKAAARP